MSFKKIVMNFCNTCGSELVQKIPEGDNRERFVCSQCDTVHYMNPKVIAGCIVEYQDKILLCKRAIEPRYGLWTVPAGFMENAETAEQGALRECYEEALARPVDVSLFAIYSIPRINQVYILYKGVLSAPEFGPGVESLEVSLYTEEDIPWHNMAFTVTTNALKTYLEMRRNKHFYAFSDII